MVGTSPASGCAAALAALTLCGVSAQSAFAGHFLGNDSVDGGEIRYEDYTKYDGARTRAIDAWNALGRIDILPDDASHVCDLEVDDVNQPSNPAFGWWQARTGADVIRMNSATLDPLSPDSERTATIRRVMAHEFGHALGIGEHLDSKWHYSALMYQYTCNSCNYIQSPLAHDRTDYYALW